MTHPSSFNRQCHKEQRKIYTKRKEFHKWNKGNKLECGVSTRREALNLNP